jgi:phytoene dehydrogenase-like protein
MGTHSSELSFSAHVASLFCQHVTPQFTDGLTWDQHREAVADLMIETVEAYAPGFKASVIARQNLSPLDQERILASATIRPMLTFTYGQ